MCLLLHGIPPYPLKCSVRGFWGCCCLWLSVCKCFLSLQLPILHGGSRLTRSLPLFVFSTSTQLQHSQDGAAASSQRLGSVCSGQQPSGGSAGRRAAGLGFANAASRSEAPSELLLRRRACLGDVSIKETFSGDISFPPSRLA